MSSQTSPTAHPRCGLLRFDQHSFSPTECQDLKLAILTAPADTKENGGEAVALRSFKLKHVCADLHLKAPLETIGVDDDGNLE
ncbi:hypothetical protein [Bosea beijingensis]